MKLIAAIALLMCGVVAFAQDEDCECDGEWVQGHDGSPSDNPKGPILVHTVQTEDCEPETVAQHTHPAYKLAYVVEIGGACSTLGWITELKILFDTSHWIDVTREEYDIAGGYEAIEEIFYLEGNRLQSFDCVVNGNVVETLFRLQHIDYNHEVRVRFNQIEECEPDPGLGGP